jgi:hypothetical protein
MINRKPPEPQYVQGGVALFSATCLPVRLIKAIISTKRVLKSARAILNCVLNFLILSGQARIIAGFASGRPQMGLTKRFETIIMYGV